MAQHEMISGTRNSATCKYMKKSCGRLIFSAGPNPGGIIYMNTPSSIAITTPYLTVPLTSSLLYLGSLGAGSQNQSSPGQAPLTYTTTQVTE